MACIKTEGPGYIFVKDFLTKDEIKLLDDYVNLALDREDVLEVSQDTQVNLSPSYYKDTLMQYFLHKKKPLMEEQTKLKLNSAYTYWRYYIYGSVLTDHIDRPACEVSATVCINKSHPWPIHMDGNWYELEPGEGVIYLGNKVKHGRKKFIGDHNAQLFLHYVDQDGPYQDHAEDSLLKR